MSEKVLKITKDNGTIHIAPLNRKAALQHQNNLRPETKKWSIEEITEEEAKNLPYKEKDFVPLSAKSIVASKDAEIEQLKKKLAQFQSAVQGGSENPGATTSVGMEWRAAVAKVGELTTIDEVNAFINGEGRKSIVEAANAKIEELSK